MGGQDPDPDFSKGQFDGLQGQIGSFKHNSENVGLVELVYITCQISSKCLTTRNKQEIHLSDQKHLRRLWDFLAKKSHSRLRFLGQRDKFQFFSCCKAFRANLAPDIDQLDEPDIFGVMIERPIWPLRPSIWPF